MRAAPAVSCAMGRKRAHMSIQGSGEHPTFPAQWLYGLSRAHPGVAGCLVSVALRKLAHEPGWAFRTSARLDASVEASGPHDFAVRFNAVRLRAARSLTELIPPCHRLRARHCCVHRSPTDVRDDHAFSNDLVIALWDGFPINPGHLLIIPRRHAPAWPDLSSVEKSAIWSAVDQGQALVSERFRPDGFNVGFNERAAAGQTVFHFHMHIIPRYAGDVADPRGGVRHVIPDKANYLAAGSESP